MPPPQLPADVWHIIKAYISPTDLSTHLSLSNASAYIRSELYASDDSWKTPVNDAGLSRPIYSPKGTPYAPDTTPTWRSIVLEVVRHHRLGCDAELVVGVDPGSEGVEAQVYWEPLCDWQMKRAAQADHCPRPLAPAQVAETSTSIELNRHLKLTSHALETWLVFDDQIRNCVGIEGNSGTMAAPVGVREHSTVAYAFATSPPVTELYFWFGQTRVCNSGGVTFWDVRQAFLHNKNLYHKTPLGVTQQPRFWLEEAIGFHHLNDHVLSSYLRDAWDQEKLGSVRFGSEAMWQGLVDLGWEGAEAEADETVDSSA